jgi:hypothetical protein
MPKQLPTPPPVSRYSYRRVVEEIEAQLDKRDIGEQKVVANAAGLDESAFSHRLTGAKSKFNLEQLGAIADFWRAPAGWPFIPWGEADEREKAWQREQAKRRKK